MGLAPTLALHTPASRQTSSSNSSGVQLPLGPKALGVVGTSLRGLTAATTTMLSAMAAGLRGVLRQLQ
jgi:hypothetical protein